MPTRAKHEQCQMVIICDKSMDYSIKKLMGLLEGFNKFEINNVLAIDCSNQNIFLFSSLKLKIKVKQMNYKKVKKKLF